MSRDSRGTAVTAHVRTPAEALWFHTKLDFTDSNSRKLIISDANNNLYWEKYNITTLYSDSSSFLRDARISKSFQGLQTKVCPPSIWIVWPVIYAHLLGISTKFVLSRETARNLLHHEQICLRNLVSVCDVLHGQLLRGLFE